MARVKAQPLCSNVCEKKCIVTRIVAYLRPLKFTRHVVLRRASEAALHGSFRVPASDDGSRSHLLVVTSIPIQHFISITTNCFKSQIAS